MCHATITNVKFVHYFGDFFFYTIPALYIITYTLYTQYSLMVPRQLLCCSVILVLNTPRPVHIISYSLQYDIIVCRTNESRVDRMRVRAKQPKFVVLCLKEIRCTAVYVRIIHVPITRRPQYKIKSFLETI